MPPLPAAATPWRLRFTAADGAITWAAIGRAVPGDTVVRARFRTTEDATQAVGFTSKLAARTALLTWGRILAKGETVKAVFEDPDAALSTVLDPQAGVETQDPLPSSPDEDDAMLHGHTPPEGVPATEPYAGADLEKPVTDTYIRPSFTTRGWGHKP